MDEPLSNLDAKLRVGMRASLAQLHARLGTTTLYVTHDQTEAMTLGQRVAVLRDGRILQVDTPQRLYGEPADVFVAAFIGTPAMNLVEATIDAGAAVFGGYRIPLDERRRPAPAHREVVLGIRPEAFAAASPDTALPTLDVTPVVVEELGADMHVLFPVTAAKAAPEATSADDDAALLSPDEVLFGARVDPRSNAAPGRPLTLTVDPSRFHFFDRETGVSLLAPSEAHAPRPLPAELATA
jgi:multiple sugar transport system ATP-binding protein